MIGDKDLLFTIKLELVVHRIRVELLNLVLVQETSPHFIEVPGDEVFAS